METLVQRQIRFIPIKEGIEFDGQQGLRTKVMIASGSYVVFQQQSGRYPYHRPKDKRSKAQRWSDAVEDLLDLQAGYQAWLDGLPENLRNSAVAEQLELICELDLDSLQEVEPPRGFGRD